MQTALNTINVNEHDRLPNSTFRNKLEVKEQPLHCCSTLVYQTQEQKLLPFPANESVFRREQNSDLLFGYCQPAKDHKVRTIFLIQVFLVYIQYLQIKHA